MWQKLSSFAETAVLRELFHFLTAGASTCTYIVYEDCAVQCELRHESRDAMQVHNKQSNTNQDNSLFKGKRSCPGGTQTHDTPLTTQSALPTELPGQLSRQGPKSTTQHNTRQSQTPILRAMVQIAQKNPHLICRSRPG